MPWLYHYCIVHSCFQNCNRHVHLASLDLASGETSFCLLLRTVVEDAREVPVPVGVRGGDRQPHQVVAVTYRYALLLDGSTGRILHSLDFSAPVRTCLNPAWGARLVRGGFLVLAGEEAENFRL